MFSLDVSCAVSCELLVCTSKGTFTRQRCAKNRKAFPLHFSCIDDNVCQNDPHSWDPGKCNK